MNWAEYDNDYILRTDAVWEKTKLKDYFRNYMKVKIYIRLRLQVLLL